MQNLWVHLPSSLPPIFLLSRSTPDRSSNHRLCTVTLLTVTHYLNTKFTVFVGNQYRCILKSESQSESFLYRPVLVGYSPRSVHLEGKALVRGLLLPLHYFVLLLSCMYYHLSFTSFLTSYITRNSFVNLLFWCLPYL
jgi:hypothetical protein